MAMPAARVAGTHNWNHDRNSDHLRRRGGGAGDLARPGRPGGPAAGRPGGKNEGGQPMRGLVQGGEHVGGGRSVVPHRDAEVPQDGGTPPPPEETADSAASARRTEHRSESPMNI